MEVEESSVTIDKNKFSKGSDFSSNQSSDEEYEEGSEIGTMEGWEENMVEEGKARGFSEEDSIARERYKSVSKEQNISDKVAANKKQDNKGAAFSEIKEASFAE